MMSFLHTMASASMRVGIVDAMPPESVIKKLSKDMFAEADENNDGGINSREWLQPCRRLRLCAALNVGLRHRRVHELGAQAWYVANLQLVVSCGTSHMRACDSPVVSQRLIAAFSQARQAAGVDPKKLRSIGDGRRDNRASVMATGQAMARAAAARKRAVRRIAQTTAFGVQEMRVIKHAFVREVGYNGALSRDQVLECDVAAIVGECSHSAGSCASVLRHSDQEISRHHQQGSQRTVHWIRHGRWRRA